MSEQSAAEALLTADQAHALTEARRVEAVAGVLSRFIQERDLSTAVAQAIAAYRKVEHVPPGECPSVHPEWGKCERDYGHEGDHYTYAPLDPRRPDGSHPRDY